jgi:quercetin dioxygenase-like cupin family protein
MLRLLTLWCGFSVAMAGIASAQAPPAAVQMDQEPHHHLVFQNEALKVFLPVIKPGETTLEHLHSYDEATVCISGSTLRTRSAGGDWSNPGRACPPGQVGVSEYAGKPASHTVQNAGDGVFHLVVVDNIRQKDWSTDPPMSAVATTLARETRAFQIFNVKLDRGSAGTTHVHSRPTIVVLVSGEAASGKKRLRQPGDWVLISAGKTHRLSAPHGAQLVEIEAR